MGPTTRPKGEVGSHRSPCLNSDLQKCRRGAEGSCPAFQDAKRGQGPEPTLSSPEGWPPIFLFKI